MSQHTRKIWAYRRENGRVGVRNHVIILPVDDLSNANPKGIAFAGGKAYVSLAGVGTLTIVPGDVPALTVNKVCLSGLNAIAMADQLISAGEFEVVLVAFDVAVEDDGHATLHVATGELLEAVGAADFVSHALR